MKEIYDNFYDYSRKCIICEKCSLYIKRKKINLEYLESSFPVERFEYSKDNNVFIDKSSVYTNMIRIEKVLEDK